MSQPRFLMDEDVDYRLVKILRSMSPKIDIVCVGKEGGPPISTKDPDILEIAFEMQRILVTEDKTTMPSHLADHFRRGKHTWGVFIMVLGHAQSRYAEDLLTVHEASTADEWQDQTLFLPFQKS